MTTAAERLASALADRYRLERELGAGGMATVYLAHDVRHDRKVAIKVLRPELAAVIGAERFLSEIKTTANLQHPHILPLFDSGESDGFLYYVMPFIEGETLRDRLTRDKQLTIADAVRIATEVADALEYAHKRGVVHRDIKPENVLLHDGRALVADFGIALAASKAGESRMTQTGMSLGTPAYMSPEQAMGEREITGRSDIYALGCMLYEMLSGDPPFTGSTAQAIVARVMTERPRSLVQQRHTIPPHVEAATLTAMEKLPADRFESAGVFAAALRDAGFAHTGARTTLLPAAREARADRRRFVTMGALTAALLALAAAGWLRRPVAPPVSRQKVTLWEHGLGRVLAPGIERYASQAAIAPDGSSIVFVDSTATGYQLLRKRRNEDTATLLAGTEGGASPFFSPDGQWIAYLTTDGRLRKVPTEGGGSITLATAGNRGYLAGAWLDDGTILYVNEDQETFRVSADGGASVPVGKHASSARVNITTLQPLPGSRGFLYSACPGNCGLESSIYVFDVAADSGRLLVADAIGAWYSPTGHVLYTDRAGGLFAAPFDVKRLRLTGGAVPVIDGVVPNAFAISAAGSVLYSLGTGTNTPTEMVWVARDGSTTSFDSTWHADFAYPALSLDGRTVAVSVREQSTQLWIRRADGTRQKLTQNGTVNWRPSWSPDGRTLAFVSNVRATDGSQDGYDVYRVPADGSAPPELLLHHTFGLWEAELSHDGEWLVVRSDEEGNTGRIRARRLHGDTALVALVVGQHSQAASQAVLSPDGRWLAYATLVGGGREVFVTPFPSAATHHVVSRSGGSEPRWSHNGRELFFKSPTALMSVDITPGAAFVAGTPRPLFPIAGYRSARNRQQYDVAPDDRHFLMIREPSDPRGDHVVFVEHWFPELLAKTKSTK
ncbi:MAG: protein kinase domain-containing protein [Gemmatimonadales bacterium]